MGLLTKPAGPTELTAYYRGRGTYTEVPLLTTVRIWCYLTITPLIEQIKEQYRRSRIGESC